MIVENTEVTRDAETEDHTDQVRTGTVRLDVVASEVMEKASYDISRRESVLRRGEKTTIRIIHSRVSRRHTKIVLDVDGIAKIIDLSSTNGTKVNNAKIGIEVLREGDRIDIAGVAVFEIHYEYFEAQRG